MLAFFLPKHPAIVLTIVIQRSFPSHFLIKDLYNIIITVPAFECGADGLRFEEKSRTPRQGSTEISSPQ